jgi:hypothetical protein
MTTEDTDKLSRQLGVAWKALRGIDLTLLGVVVAMANIKGDKSKLAIQSKLLLSLAAQVQAVERFNREHKK